MNKRFMQATGLRAGGARDPAGSQPETCSGTSVAVCWGTLWPGFANLRCQSRLFVSHAVRAARDSSVDAPGCAAHQPVLSLAEHLDG